MRRVSYWGRGPRSRLAGIVVCAALIGLGAVAGGANARHVGAEGAATRLDQGWSGHVSLSYSSSGHTDVDQAMQQLSAQITLMGGRSSSTTSASFAYSRQTDCGGTNTTTGSGHGAGATASIGSVSPGSYDVQVGLTVPVTVTIDETDPFHGCARSSRKYDSSISIGVARAVARGNAATASRLSGSRTLGPGTGCAGAQPGPEFTAYPNDTCTLTISWDLQRPVCDPALMDKALREYRAADDLFAAGQKELDDAYSAFLRYRGEELHANVEIGKEKFLVLKALNGIDGSLAGTVAEDVLFTEFEALAEAIAFWGGPLFTLDWIATDVVPNGIVPWHRAMARSKKILDAADKLADKGRRDLERALAQSKACLAQSRRLRNQERLHDQAKALIESWENNGYLYMDPTRGELLDEQAALKRAYEILTKPMSRSLNTAAREARSRHPTFTKPQLQQALRYYDRLIPLGKKALAWHERSLANTDRTRKRLRALLSHMRF